MVRQMLAERLRVLVARLAEALDLPRAAPYLLFPAAALSVAAALATDRSASAVAVVAIDPPALVAH